MHLAAPELAILENPELASENVLDNPRLDSAPVEAETPEVHDLAELRRLRGGGTWPGEDRQTSAARLGCVAPGRAFTLPHGVEEREGCVRKGDPQSSVSCAPRFEALEDPRPLLGR